MLISAHIGEMPMDEDDTMVLSLKPKRDPRDRRPLIASVQDTTPDS